MDFNWALDAMRSGSKVKREKWSNMDPNTQSSDLKMNMDQNTFVYITINDGSFVNSGLFTPNSEVIIMNTQGMERITNLHSPAILANDWVLVANT